jgi:hypothetical protein
MISKVRIAARVSHGVVIIRLGSQCVVARLGAALAGRVGLGGSLGASHCAVAEVHNRLVQSAEATANAVLAFGRDLQSVVKDGSAGLNGLGFELGR